MSNKITRRKALLGFSSSLLIPAARSTDDEPPAEASALSFAHGVASGDPGRDSMVLWTRVSGADAPVDVDWMIAADEDFTSVVNRGRFRTSADRDYTVKVIADGLAAGTDYYYRFAAGGNQSPLGRTKTLAQGQLDSLTIAVATCSNYPFGFFNAYEAIADDESIDVVAHLGDYMYEYGAGQYGDSTGAEIGRQHLPRYEILTLDDYRTRHAQYKSDEGSIAMHGRHPLIPIWDDHESANNPWMEGAQNHQPEEGDWGTRRSESLQAWYEWMPVRDPMPGVPPEEYWRHYQFGDLASLITLESRHTGRSLQMEYGDLARFELPEEAQAFYWEVIGAPDRTFLSDKMERFLADALQESVTAGRRWRILGNQSVMARVVTPLLEDAIFDQLAESDDETQRNLVARLRQHGELGLPGDLDAWSGYPAARARLFDLARAAGASDLLVISGDSHSYWANQLFDDEDNRMGVELGSTGITSPRGLLSLGEEGLQRYDQLAAEQNREVVWTEGRYRGFIRLTLNRDSAVADYITVTNILSRDYETQTIRSMAIERDGDSLRFA